MTANEKYEAKKKELSRHFAKQYLKTWVVFFIYNIVADTVIYLILKFLSIMMVIVGDISVIWKAVNIIVQA